MEKLDTYHFPYLNNFVASSFYWVKKLCKPTAKLI